MLKILPMCHTLRNSIFQEDKALKTFILLATALTYTHAHIYTHIMHIKMSIDVRLRFI